MSDLNHVRIIGRMCGDPELKYIPNGTAVTSFSVATNEEWKSKDGEKQKRAEFHRVVAWGKLAEYVGQYLQKGRQVHVEGRIQTREWEAQGGEKRKATEIVAARVDGLGPKPGERVVADRSQVPAEEPEEELPF